MAKMGFESNKRLVRDFNNQPQNVTIDGKAYHFRSKLEYRWALWCQFRKEHDLIKDWWNEQTTFKFPDEFKGVKMFLIDFDIRTNDDEIEYEECKGWLQSSDFTKF